MRVPIQILIVDDHAMVRKALARFFESADEIKVVGEAPDGATAVEMVKIHRPDIVLMDYNMPHMNGVEATRQILTDHPDIQVIGLSMHENGSVETAMLEAGAVAYLKKDSYDQTLLSTIRELAASNGW